MHMDKVEKHGFWNEKKESMKESKSTNKALSNLPHEGALDKEDYLIIFLFYKTMHHHTSHIFS